VHEEGTRITSLRRLALKPRYFTNGSAATLEDVLARFAEGEHDGARRASLSAETRRALLAFLRLL
jgi:cytochrome c peroxidase